MSKFKCIRSFFWPPKMKSYNEGQIIQSSEFNTIGYPANTNFIQVYEDDGYAANSSTFPTLNSDDDISSPSLDNGSDYSIGSDSYDSGSSATPGSSDSGFDFGGGDSGGGGASGDW